MNKYTCDREIGSPVKGWHRCGARAAYLIQKSDGHGSLLLGACNRHLEPMQSSVRGTALRLASVRPC